METKMKYQTTLSLIQYLADFEAETQSTDLREFACWLAQKLSPHPIKERFSKENIDKTPYGIEVGQWDMNAHIGVLIGRMARFSRMYAKKALDGLAIQSIEEFGFLMGIFELKNPTKSELVNMSLVEMTTGVEIIRRLVKAGLITEQKDTVDKRAKRLTITQIGQEVLMKALKGMHTVGETSVGFLSEEEKLALIAILSKLNRTHTDQYLNQKENH